MLSLLHSVNQAEVLKKTTSSWKRQTSLKPANKTSTETNADSSGVDIPLDQIKEESTTVPASDADHAASLVSDSEATDPVVLGDEPALDLSVQKKGDHGDPEDPRGGEYEEEGDNLAKKDGDGLIDPESQLEKPSATQEAPAVAEEVSCSFMT